MKPQEWHTWTQGYADGRSIWKCAKCGKVYNRYIPFGWRPMRFSLLPCVPAGEKAKRGKQGGNDGSGGADHNL